MIFVEEQKTNPITGSQVMKAFKRVRANDGSAGVDKLTIAQVNSDQRKYLYPLWNRLASGSYHPQPVRQKFIDKGNGKLRPLGIPTILDRVAQQVIATELEDMVDRKFSVNSFGYRPNKSAHDAIKQCRINCMKYSWVVDLDIKGFFDNIDHELMMKAVAYHTNKPYILMYCKRWLEAPIEQEDKTLKHHQGKGTPQGGVISPILANIFLDIVFDKWMDKHYPTVPFERYADDIVIHCRHFKDSMRLMEAITKRFQECKLELSQEKSKIVYCRQNQKKHPPFEIRHQTFDFLGFSFKPRMVRVKGKMRMGFTPAISQKNTARIISDLRKLNLHRCIHVPLSKIGEMLKSKIRGWLNYYAKFRKSELSKLFRVVNLRLAKWVSNKYRRFRRKHWYNSFKYLQGIAKSYPYLFEHWKCGFQP